jgi:hypothetical protein
MGSATGAQEGSGPAVLFAARGGNIHGFTAVTDTAVLDLLTPPYDAGAGGRCCSSALVLPCMVSTWLALQQRPA